MKGKTNSNVFITNAETLTALTVARSLGKKGITVDCGEEFPHSITAFSKYVNNSLVYPEVDSEPEEFVQFIRDIEEENRYDTIIPTDEDTTEVLSNNRGEIDASILLPAPDSVDIALDKGKTMKRAKEEDVSIPKTYFPNEIDLEEVPVSPNKPIVIKPRRGSGSRGIGIAKSHQELSEKYERISEEYNDPIFQEYISHGGTHYSLCALYDTNSDITAIHMYEENAQYPTSGGPAVRAQSVPVQDWAYDILQLLNSLDWIGPAHLDVLIDPSNNTPKVLEINPRFWTSLGLTVQSGVDIPYYLYQISTNRHSGELVDEYDTDLQYRWFFPNEILWLSSQKDTLSSAKKTISKFSYPTSYAILSTTDPLPTVGAALQSIYFLLDSERRAQILDRGWTNPSQE